MRLAGKLMISSPPRRIGAPGSGAQAMAVITSQLAGSFPSAVRSGSYAEAARAKRARPVSVRLRPASALVAPIARSSRISAGTSS